MNPLQQLLRTPHFGLILETIGALILFLALNAYCLSLQEGDNYKVYQDFTMVGRHPAIWIMVVVGLLLHLLPWTKGWLHPRRIPRPLRIGFFLLGIFVAWNYVFYEFNFFMNEWHSVDRVMIAVTALLCFRFPLLLIPLVAHIYLSDYQFNFPLGGSKLLDKSMPLEVLKLFVGWFLVASLMHRARTKDFDLRPLFFLILSAYGLFYFHSGLQKILLSESLYSWAFENKIIYNLLAIRDRGWLQNAPDWLTQAHFSYFKVTSSIGQLLVLITEVAAVGVLWSRKYARVLIIGIMILHAHVFVLNGALFWLWISVGLFLFYALGRYVDGLCSWRTLLLSIPVMLLFSFTMKIAKLGWYDSRLDNYFELEAKTNDGSTEIISLNSIKPYTLHFQYGNFLSVVDYKNIYPGFLIIDKEVFQQLNGLDSAGAMNLIETSGKNYFRPLMHLQLSNLLDSFLLHGPSGEEVNAWIDPLQAPAYWICHATDTLPEMKPSQLSGIALYHTNVLREADGQRTVLWRRLVMERQRP